MTETKAEKPPVNLDATQETSPYKRKCKKTKEILKTWSRHVDINCYAKIMAYRPNYKVQAIWRNTIFVLFF